MRPIRLKGFILASTDKAIRFQSKDGPYAWLPLTMVDIFPKARGAYEIEILTGFAKKKGLIK